MEEKRILHMTLKKKWYDMIASGYKKEEYRVIKPYWESRFIDEKKQERLDAQSMDCSPIAWKEFDVVCFKNGYSKNAPTITLEFKGFDIGDAKPEWSDNWQGEVFIIKLGNIINQMN